jgi:hypothetical protein
MIAGAFARGVMRKGVLALLVVALLAGRSVAETVDLELVLLADVSRSVDDEEFKLQRQGYAAALMDPRVLRAFFSGAHRAVALTFIEFAGADEQTVIAGWTIVRDEEGAAELAQKILTSPRAHYGRTGIGAAIEFAMVRFGQGGVASERRVIDVSADGTSNSGRAVQSARDAAVAAGVTINALVIVSEVPSPWNPAHTHPPGGLPEYFRENVIGGVDAFHLVVEDFKSFGEAVVKKLVREIAGASQRGTSHAAVADR